jgi:Flp pilus assembly protein TadB
MTGVLLAGAACGLGVLLLVQLFGGGPASARTAAAALAEIDARRDRRRRDVSLTVDRRHQAESARLRRLGRSLLETLDARGIRLPGDVLRDLALVGRSAEMHLAASVVAAVAGLMVPLVTLSIGSLVAPVLRAGAPLWVGLACGLVGGLLPTAVLASRASGRRRDFRHTVGSFLDMVAMNLSGGRGIPEALQSASSISEGWAMVRIRDTLERARLQGATPWAALGLLGEETGIDELRDLAMALALVADDGAKIRESLAARAASLRRRELADAEGRAQARSQSMLVAQLLLALGFLVFLVYPAAARVLGS